MPKDKLKIAVDAREFKHNHLTGIGRFLKLFLDGIKSNNAVDICLLADEKNGMPYYEGCFKVIKEKLNA